MDQELDELLKWAAEHGAHDSVSAPLLHQAGHLPRQSRRNERRSCLETTLAVATFPEAGGRGLAATRDLTAGEALLAVPEQLLMTAKSARTDAILGPLLTRSPGLTSHQVLIVHLLHEVAKGAASFWRPYLLALPRVHHTLAHFSAPQVLHLQFPHAMEAARRARTEAHRDWAAAAPLLQDLGLPPKFRRFKAWLWAAATVTSRSVAIPFDSAGALCPVGDLFNYAAPSEEDQTARLTDGAFDAETRCFRFYARENYRTGQQVLLCYGAYRNLDLLEHYGFLLPDNPNDAVTILLPASLLPKAASFVHRIIG
ncbi:hypothetical protein KFL_008880020 [Klebsormidium nitens]|uniref:SET domain-containing protein n=1 Tax=Klebsormidium nitens TaxID=105231 RepID=A0A1Y1IT15_KLENI|nr:hypothetical protein KFL_008880020 [Klebsormidium nitens]|eukprot:GAQ91946.1 hypothetical protein KFL_008880020 [Klebsormidium nitens]